MTRTVLVAGGSEEVGEGLVAAFLDARHTVVVPTRSAGKVEEIRGRVGGTDGRLHVEVADLADDASAQDLRRRLREAGRESTDVRVEPAREDRVPRRRVDVEQDAHPHAGALEPRTRSRTDVAEDPLTARGLGESCAALVAGAETDVVTHLRGEDDLRRRLRTMREEQA